MPPVTVKSIDPSLPPMQVTFTVVVDSDNALGSVMVTLTESSQPTLSVTTTSYVPAVNPVISWVVAELDHE